MSCDVEEPVATDEPRSAENSWSLNYVTGNLFFGPQDEALAHCISEDCRMGAGIAVLFKRKFGGVAELKEQKKMTGECAVLKQDGRFVYYLCYCYYSILQITKKKASQKPTYDSLRLSLEDMKSHCVKNAVTKISMPRIGCGLDRLEWARVSVILEQVFKHTNISITVYSLPVKAESTVMEENRRR
ncbi:ADP-ribose glycohydrolase OARD1 isoform X1 [Solea solea]|uniref:ADP-ribose glycohydrolase OARD1 isoform X1 n=1 Tax=Solea solea TaxID=90069 RepID=UPI00272D3CE0|nr:ADP-ribose glycohydrolase OARD1 isoform X1 [Solea solea]